jgi:coenzyme F420-reducing hydrogenase alpha subunit
MLTHYLPRIVLLLVLFTINNAVYADIYKWADDEDEIHYSQFPPELGTEVELIKTPLPPSFEAEESENQLKLLLEQQKEQNEQAASEYEKQQLELKKHEVKQANCARAHENLKLYQNQSVKRITHANGDVTRIIPSLREQRLAQYQDDIARFCN